MINLVIVNNKPFNKIETLKTVPSKIFLLLVNSVLVRQEMKAQNIMGHLV